MRSHSTLSSDQPPRQNRAKRKKRRLPICRTIAVLAVMAIAYHQLRSALQQPQAILVLGGAEERELFATQFAHEHPDLPIWVSSGAPPEYLEFIFEESGIAPERLHLDYQAVDTVTNFTTLVQEFEERDINSVYLITSDYHMRRARVIGSIVFWSQGIDFKPVSVPSERPPEPVEKAIRDGARSVLWVFTGHTGSTLGQRLRGQVP